MITYDKRIGGFRGDKGRIVSREKVRGIVQSEILRTEGEINKLTNLYIQKKISLIDLQVRSVQLLKTHNIQMGLLAVGGINQVSNKFSFYGTIGYRLRELYGNLQQRIVAIAEGNISPKMLQFRMRQLARYSLVTYGAVEKNARVNEGFNQGLRSLDPGAKHCRQCPNFETPGWVPIVDIVTPGVDCPCGGFCKCTVRYRRYVE